MLRVRALHSADGRPFLHEDRWVRIDSVPEVLDADLESVSANEWLVRNVPLVRGDIEFGAVAASAVEAAGARDEPRRESRALPRPAGDVEHEEA